MINLERFLAILLRIIPVISFMLHLYSLRKRKKQKDKEAIEQVERLKIGGLYVSIIMARLILGMTIVIIRDIVTGKVGINDLPLPLGIFALIIGVPLLWIYILYKK
jgi:hypothetical protein